MLSLVAHLIRAIDAHVGGQSLRLVVDGVPAPGGRTIGQQAAWLRRHADHVRKAIVLEPRGHRDLLAAQLVATTSPGTHAGVVFMGAAGYPAMSGHGIIAVATIGIERGLIVARDDAAGEVRLALETAAGTIQTRSRVDARAGVLRVDSVAFTNVPAFVHAAGQPVRIGARELRVDVAFGGQFYAIVDTEAVGIPLAADRLPDLRRVADTIVASLATPRADRPDQSAAVSVSGVIFTGPPQDPESHLRTVTVSEGGAVDRSPGGAGMSAVMSVLDAMGLLPDDRPFVQEGLVGSLFRGRVIARTAVGVLPAISTEIEGSAWITGDHTFVVSDEDPFRDGFMV
jgi:proline racemase